MIFDINDIRELLKKGNIQFPSCLILGYSNRGEGTHLVCSLGQDNVWMITAYYPDKNEWLEDLKTRRS